MLKLFNNFNLRQYNSFGIEVTTKYFVEFTTEKDLIDYLSKNLTLVNENSLLIIGGGTNILFTKNYNGILFHSLIDKLEVLKEEENYILLKVGGGILWEHFVEYAVMNDYQGIENLSLIPGNVGSSAVQNIGAYGVEAKDCIESVECIDLLKNTKHIYSNKECQFAYRDSIFKKKTNLLITFVIYKLRKNTSKFNLEYGELKKHFLNTPTPCLKDIREAIIKIREGKLPNPRKIGNAGSFFKNPVVTAEKYDSLKQKYPEIVAFPFLHTKMKLAAGWLIEACGWKGKVIGNVGVYEKQALVIFNKGQATGKEILDFSQQIIDSVFEKFEIRLEPEVIIK